MNVLTSTSAESKATLHRTDSLEPAAGRIQSMRARCVGDWKRRHGWVGWLGTSLLLASFTCLPVKGQTVVATVPAGLGPTAVAVNPRTNKIYVADFFGNANGITVIDGKTNTSKTLTTYTGQTAVAVNPLTNMIYFVDAFNYLTVVDGTNDTVVTPLPGVLVGGDPVAVAVNPAKNLIYVANQTGSTVSVIDGTNNTVKETLNLTGGPNLLQGFGPSALFVDPVTNQVYVTCQSATMLIDWATNSVSQLAYTGGLVGGGPVGVNPVTNTLYAVEGGDSTVLVIDETTNPATEQTVSTDLAAPFDVALNPVTNKTYVLNTIGPGVTVIDGNNSNATSQVSDPNAKNPSAVTVNPMTNKVYVTNSGSNNVTVINGATDATGATYGGTVNVGTDPVAIAENPVTNMVYVANNSSNNVTVIAGTGTAQTIPITTTITPLTGDKTSSASPTFTFSAVSTFAPTAPPVEAVYFQVDSEQGPWSQATSTGGGNFSGAAASLSQGSHTLHAFATDGQDATSTITGMQSSPLIGSIASYTFSVTASGPAFSASPSPLAFGNQTQGTTSSAKTLTITNTGTASLSISSVVEGGIDAVDFPIGSDACNGAALAAGATCAVSVKFAPTTTAAESATLTFTDNASGSPQVVNLTGSGTAPVATASTTALSASATSIAVGSSVTLTATVTPASGTPTPTGTVTFKDGTTALGTGTLNSSGVATYSTSALAEGAHSITASYSGDSRNLASNSSAVAVTVAAASSTTALTASAPSGVVGASITFTATVTGGTGSLKPTGTVTFHDGSTTLGTGALNASGVATYSTSALAAGSHSVTASYGGDTNNAASVSSSVAVTIWPGPPDFTLALSPASGSYKAGTPATVTVTITSVNGFNATTALACGSLPKNTVCDFSSVSVTPGVSGTMTSTLTIDTDTKPKTTARAGRPFGQPVLAAGTALAFLLIPLFGARNRKLRRMLVTLSYLGLLAALASAGISGCGGGGPTTPKGTYSIQVTGTSGSLSHSATFSLTVQ